MTPEQLRTDDSVAFIASVLPAKARVLEVGCGRGAVARDLATRGFDVTALDLTLRDLVPAPGVRFIEADFRRFKHEAFDAVVFTSSLHHITPLGDAIARAARLLETGGYLVADEFDVDAPDAATLHWYYETQELLVAAGLLPADRVDPPAPNLRMRWDHAHHHDEPLHTGASMERTIASQFSNREVRRPPYLYRYIAAGLSQDDRGAALAAQLRLAEQRGIDAGVLRPVGLRIVARLARTIA
jgi:SAM-dependent methyltransferase